MALADPAQREDKPNLAIANVALVGMQHGAGIEQRRALIGVFLTEIGSDQSASRIVTAIGTFEVIGNLLKRRRSILSTSRWFSSSDAVTPSS